MPHFFKRKHEALTSSTLTCVSPSMNDEIDDLAPLARTSQLQYRCVTTYDAFFPSIP